MQLAQSIERYGEGHPVTSRLFNQVGNVHFRRGDFTRAASCYERAAQCESEQQHIALLNLGTVYWRTNQVDTAIDYLKRARQHCRRRCDAAAGGVAEPVHSNNSNEAIQASVYHQLGLCYALRQDYPRSIQALHKAYNIRVQQHGMDHHTSIAQTLDAMGKVYLMMGEYDAAIHCHGRALTIVTASASSSSTHPYQRHQPAATTTNTRSTMESLRNLAAVFRAAGRSSDLLETLSEQLRLLGSSSPSSDHPTMTVEEQQLRAEIARLQNELAGC
jgi:tetratricopeptide (TPR) repeat protein